MTDVRIVLVTVPDAAVGEALSVDLVERGLAACASFLPGLTSVYRWEGEVQRASEQLVLIKTSRARVADLIARVAELHPYDVPEVLAVPVEAGFGPYLAWVERESRGGAR